MGGGRAKILNTFYWHQIFSPDSDVVKTENCPVHLRNEPRYRNQHTKQMKGPDPQPQTVRARKTALYGLVLDPRKLDIGKNQTEVYPSQNAKNGCSYLISQYQRLSLRKHRPDLVNAKIVGYDFGHEGRSSGYIAWPVFREL